MHDRSTPAFLTFLPFGIIVHGIEILDQAAVEVDITLGEGKPIRATKQRTRRCGNAAEVAVQIPGVVLSGCTYGYASCPALPGCLETISVQQPRTSGGSPSFSSRSLSPVARDHRRVSYDAALARVDAD